jgi:hypothetical protein
VSLPYVLLLVGGLVYSLAELEARGEARRHRRVVAQYIFRHGENAFIKVCLDLTMSG